MRLKVLGCSGGIGKDLRTSSYLVDNDILLDAGTGVGSLTLDEMKKLKHIFVTHSHLDHVCSIPLLIDILFDCLTEPLNIYGSKKTIEALKAHVFNWTLWPDFAALPNKDSAVMKYHILQPGEDITLGNRTVSHVDVNHVIPAVAYYVKNTVSSVCYSGDTMSCDTLWDAINEKELLSMLIVECAFPNENEALATLAKHYCPNTLSKDLKRLNLKNDVKIAITHLKPSGEADTKQQLQSLCPDIDFIWLENDTIYDL
jgi:ribonuclease BN (tRNA processing enzyme)